MAPRLAVVVVVALAAAVAHGEAGVRGAGTLRGSVACLDCAPGHDLSGVVVAVRCGGGGGGGGGAGQLRAAQTDERGGFDVAVPAGGGDVVDGRRSHPHQRCAARVLGGAEQLCAPGGLAVAPVVAAAGPEHGSYALASSLAVFTRCGGGGLASTAAATGNGQSPAPPRARRATPRAGRATPPPYAGPGLPLIYFFPFLPIIGIP
uniref:Uncharacterized protein n=1 Tax=Oryza meridionalis TaxID=40149 RepID=A0A0E0CLJ6_9ORYZ